MSDSRVEWFRRYMAVAEEAMRAYATGEDESAEDSEDDSEDEGYTLPESDELALTKQRLADAIGQVATLKDALRERDSQPEARAREEAEAVEAIRHMAYVAPPWEKTELAICRAEVDRLEKEMMRAKSQVEELQDANGCLQRANDFLRQVPASK